MSKYSSLLFSPEEYYEIGPFRFPVYHDLVPGETRGMEELSRQQSRYTFSSIKLAKAIAKDQGITTKEAIELLSSTDETTQDIFYDYAAELDDLQQLSISPTQVKLSTVTLAMRYRGEVQLPGSEEWTPTKDWTDEDSELVPTKLLTRISEFIGWERDGWPTGKPTDEAQNPPPSKLSPTASKSSEVRPRTGTTST